MNGETAGRTAAVRLLMLCTVLLGLLLMHGNPAAATGCHDGMPLSATVSADEPMMLGHPAEPMPSAAVQAPGASAGGELCVSTPARGGATLPGADALPAGLLVTVAAVLGLRGRAGGRLADGCRAPPRSGRELLLQVCIART